MTTPKADTVQTSPCKGEVGREAAGRGSRFSRTKPMTKRAQRLRAKMTDAERKLWQGLRRNRIEGLRFRRQHPVRPFALDFYCLALRLAIAVDGGQHNNEANRVADELRTQFMNGRNIRLIRFWNSEVLRNFPGVLFEISRIARECRAPRKTPSPPLPLSGGGRSRGSL